MGRISIVAIATIDAHDFVGDAAALKLFGDGTRVSVFPHKNGGGKRLGGITVVVKFGQGVGDEFSLVGNRGKVPELDVTRRRGRW